MSIQEKIYASLAPLIPLLNQVDDAWCVFGSAALALNGFTTEVHDIDILINKEASYRLEQFKEISFSCSQLDANRQSSLFRSHLLLIKSVPLCVEVSGGLEFCDTGNWESIKITDSISHAKGIRYASLEDCVRLMKLFNRPKDRARLSELSLSE